MAATYIEVGLSLVTPLVQCEPREVQLLEEEFL